MPISTIPCSSLRSLIRIADIGLNRFVRNVVESFYGFERICQISRIDRTAYTGCQYAHQFLKFGFILYIVTLINVTEIYRPVKISQIGRLLVVTLDRNIP